MKISNLSLRTKLMVLLIVPVFLATSIGIYISALRIKMEGRNGLIDKSSAILSRMEAVRTYMGRMTDFEKEVTKLKNTYPDGKIPEEVKDELYLKVPIVAAWNVGKDNASADLYEFRIASDNPRNKDNKATEQESEFLKKIKEENLQSLVYEDEDNDKIKVMRPVRYKASQGCLVCHGSPQNSPFGNGNDILGYKMENRTDNYLHGMFIIESDTRKLQSEVNTAILAISIPGIFIAFVSILLGFSLINRITLTVAQIHDFSKIVSSGNLTQELEIQSNDELGELASHINAMVLSLNKVLLQVQDAAVSLNQATNEITSTSMQISQGAQLQASSFEQLTSSIQQTSHESTVANEVTYKANSNAEIVNIGMKNLVDSMSKIETSSHRIKDVIKLMSDISMQTNLLALNAAVEAARAGAHGKGFSVVAAEVRKLAEKSAISAKEISETIGTMVNEISQGVAISNKAKTYITDIIELVNKAANQLQGITAAAKEQSIGMDNANNIVSSNAAAAEELSASAESLSDQAQQLSDMVEQFKLKRE